MTPKTTNGDSNCDPQALVNLGIKVVEEEVKISDLPEGYYFFRRAFEKRVHFSSSVKSEEFDLKKPELHYRNVDGCSYWNRFVTMAKLL